jgi:alanine dehydrogenase
MVLVIDESDVAKVLDYSTAIGAVEDAFREQGSGNTVMPVRLTIRVDRHEGVSAFMPAYLPGRDSLGIKVVSAFQKNKKDFGLPTVMGSIILLDSRSGAPMAVVDGTSVTAVRTAAASAVATKYMAREDASTLGIFGSGVQAETHLLAISVVRNLSEVLVTSRDKKKCEEFCRRMSAATGLRVKPASPEEVAAGDIVVTATTSKTPVFDGDWVRDGAHVNGIGSHAPTARELDEKIVSSSRIVVDSLEANLREAGDLIIPMAEGKFSKERVHAELGEVVLGKKRGRESSEEKTLFKSVGLAIEDVATASVAYERARAAGIGREVSF